MSYGVYPIHTAYLAVTIIRIISWETVQVVHGKQLLDSVFIERMSIFTCMTGGVQSTALPVGAAPPWLPNNLHIYIPTRSPRNWDESGRGHRRGLSRCFMCTLELRQLNRV